MHHQSYVRVKDIQYSSKVTSHLVLTRTQLEPYSSVQAWILKAASQLIYCKNCYCLTCNKVVHHCVYLLSGLFVCRPKPIKHHASL